MIRKQFIGGLGYVVFILIITFAVWPAFATQWVSVAGGQFTMGDLQGDDNETLSLQNVRAFDIMRYEVTNQEFSAFVTATGYISDVQRNGEAHVWTNRWQRNKSANYLQPHGSQSSIHGLDDHPVVQVSGRDATVFCMYHGARLPTEIEWEFAARGQDQRRFPWGDDTPRQHNGQKRANFGTDDCCAATELDGFKTTAPVGSYPDGNSPFGISDLAGNVWEWTSTPFPGNHRHLVIRGGGWGNNAYCLRASYRHGNPPGIGLNMVGFRCAR